MGRGLNHRFLVGPGWRGRGAAVGADRCGRGTSEARKRHGEILAGLMKDGQATGPLVIDAALDALAIERGGTVQTADRDFHRFPGPSFEDPLA